MTVSCSATPTCCAARPMPLFAYMVSSMSAINCFISGVTADARALLAQRGMSVFNDTQNHDGRVRDQSGPIPRICRMRSSSSSLKNEISKAPLPWA